MGLRPFLTFCFVVLGAAAIGSIGVGVWLIESRLRPETAAEFGNLVIVYGGAAAFLLVAIIAVIWGYLDHALAQPLAVIVRGIQTVVHARSDYRIEIDDAHQLDGLPNAVNELIRELGLARTSVNEAIDKATASIETQKKQLATILMDLHEGVIVCTLEHRILLYNNRALQLLRIGRDIGLDRSLFHFLTQQPILHALSRLNNRLAQGRGDSPLGGRTVPFVGSTSDGKHTLEGRMGLMLDGTKSASGYVLSFEDRTDELAALALRDRLLREATEGLLAPVGNLRAAAEILAGGGNLSIEEQAGFERVLLQESQQLGAPAGNTRGAVPRGDHRPLADERYLHIQPVPNSRRQAARTARHHRDDRRCAAMDARRQLLPGRTAGAGDRSLEHIRPDENVRTRGGRR